MTKTYLAIHTIQLKPGSIDAVRALFDEKIPPLARPLDAWRGANMSADREKNEIVTIGTWADAKQMQAFLGQPAFGEAMAGFAEYFAAPPTESIVEVVTEVGPRSWMPSAARRAPGGAGHPACKPENPAPSSTTAQIQETNMTTTSENQNATSAAPAPQAPAVPAIATDAITIIKPSERVALPSPPGVGFYREACVDDGNVWAGFVSTDPGSASPWHHHGEHTTYVLLLQGECVVEFGEERLHLRADGSMGIVPPGLVHREINVGATKNQFLVMRVGHGPAVFPAEPPAGAS